jgi:phospholipid/cholesterol/gamma-HCH transport system ATP-binding protein
MTPHIATEDLVIAMRGVAASSPRSPTLLVTEGIDWTVRRGECWVVAGLQGVGKTGFLLLTGGLIPPAAGTYTLLGQQMPIFESDRLSERLRVGMVFESGRLLNHLTVGQNIALPLRYHENLGAEEAAERLAPLIEMLGLAPWTGSTPGTLGRNWQKRAGLARALALRPEVLVLDNPLGGLDPVHAHWWVTLLEELARGHSWLANRPMTLVLSAEDLEPWRGSRYLFALLQDRRFIPVGSWSELEKHPEPVLQELLAGAPRVRESYRETDLK